MNHIHAPLTPTYTYNTDTHPLSLVWHRTCSSKPSKVTMMVWDSVTSSTVAAYHVSSWAYLLFDVVVVFGGEIMRN